MNQHKVKIAAARLENQAAAAPYSRSSIPGPLRSGWNLEDSPAVRRGEILAATPDLPAASIARIKRLQTLALGSRAKATPPPASPPSTGEETVKIPMSFSPPRYRIAKAGPRKGQPIEETWCLRLIKRHVTFTACNGETVTFTATAKIKGDGIVPPSTVSGRSFSATQADFKARWGAATATTLAAFLAFQGE